MIGEVIMAMAHTNRHDTRRIGHALKVYGLAKCIAEREKVDANMLMTVEIAAVLHDIGICYCEQTFGKCNGKMQEQYGPEVATRILDALGADKEITKRVAYLIAHHHTYKDIDGVDYRIIVEADFLVNLDEGNITKSAFDTAYTKYFRTAAGRELGNAMYVI